MEAGGREETRKTTLHGCTFEIPAWYENLVAVGKGSYGMVVSAIDRRTGEAVAIKKICPMSAYASDAKRALREIRLLSHLGRHENIVTLSDLFCREAGDELYLVMELLDSDLHRIIRSTQVLTISHHRVFMLQLLRGVKFLHDNRIIHRDLKPGNILINRNCELRITDFGLARVVPEGAAGAETDDGVNEHMTEHVVTRWYRPPELMLSPNGYYSFPVDMWSVGCILAELLGKQPLFPGRDFVDQLKLIFGVVGAPSEAEVLHIRGKEAQSFLRSVRGVKPTPLAGLFPGADRGALDLLASLLKFNPEERLNTTEALEHPFLEEFRDDPFEPPSPLTDLSFDFEKRGLPRAALRRLVLEEVAGFQEDRARRHKQPSSSGDNRRQSGAGSSPAVSVPEGGAEDGAIRDGDSECGGGSSVSSRSRNRTAADLQCTPLSCSPTDSEEDGEARQTHRRHSHGRAPGCRDDGPAKYFADPSVANDASCGGGGAGGRSGAYKRRNFGKGPLFGLFDGRSFEDSERDQSTPIAASRFTGGTALQAPAHGNGDGGSRSGDRGAKLTGAGGEEHGSSGSTGLEEVERERGHQQVVRCGSGSAQASMADVAGYFTSGTSTTVECERAASAEPPQPAQLPLPLLESSSTGDRDIAPPLPPPPPAAAASQQQQQRRPHLYWSRSGSGGAGLAAAPPAAPAPPRPAVVAAAGGRVHPPPVELSAGQFNSNLLQQLASPPDSPPQRASITHFTRNGSPRAAADAGSVAPGPRAPRRQAAPAAAPPRVGSDVESSSAPAAASAHRRVSNSLSAAAKKLLPVSKQAKIGGAGIFRPSWRQRLPLPVRGVPLAGAGTAGASGVGEEGDGGKGGSGGARPLPPAGMMRSNSGSNSTGSASGSGGSGSFSSHLSSGIVEHGAASEENDPSAAAAGAASTGPSSAAGLPSLGLIPAPPDVPYPMLRAGSSGRMAADRLLLRRGSGRSASEGNIDRALVAAALTNSSSSPNWMGRSCAFSLGSLGDSGGRPNLGQRPPFLCDILEDSVGVDGSGNSGGGGSNNGSSRRLVAMKGPLPQLGVNSPLPPPPGPVLGPVQAPLRTARVYSRPLSSSGNGGGGGGGGGNGQRPLQLQPMRPLHPPVGTALSFDGSVAGATVLDSQEFQQRKPPPSGLRRSGRSRSVNDGLRDLGRVTAGDLRGEL